MDDQSIMVEHMKVLDRFPDRLKELVLSELRAGNRIVSAGGGHPAPPAGEQIMLAHDLMGEHDVTGLDVYARNTSLHHVEITDDARFYWVLTAPLPAPAEPDMNAIRQRIASQALPPEPKVYPPGTVEMDYRGEMLIYHEADRKADIIWTWNKGSRLYRSTLSPWWYRTERVSRSMTDEERDMVLERFMAFAHVHIGTFEMVD